MSGDLMKELYAYRERAVKAEAEIERLWVAIGKTIARADDYGDSSITRPIRDLPYFGRKESRNEVQLTDNKKENENG